MNCKVKIFVLNYKSDFFEADR